MLRILLISLERTRIVALKKAANVLRAELGAEIVIENVRETDLLSDSIVDLPEKVRNTDVVITSHILSDDAVALIKDALIPERQRLIILPFSSGGGLMRLLNVGGFSFKEIEKPEQKKSEGASKLRTLLMSIAGEDDLTARLKDLMELAPKLLRFIPGSAQGLRYFVESYLAWLEPNEANTISLLKILLKLGDAKYKDILYDAPTVIASDGIYHPKQKVYFKSTHVFLSSLPKVHERKVGLLLPRTTVISNDTGYIDELIALFDEQAITAIPVFSEAFDSRKTLKKFFADTNGTPTIHALVNLTGFPLVGGHVKSEPQSASAILKEFAIPYFAPITLTHQSIADWQQAREGLSPVQVATNICLPELDGAIEPLVIAHGDTERGKDLIQPNAQRFIERVTKRIALFTLSNNKKKIAIVLYCFPPARGAVGSAAYLDVAKSLHNTLLRLKSEGYDVTVPTTSEEVLHDIIGSGDSFASSSTPLNVAAKMTAREYQQLVPMWRDAAKEWGEPPGDVNSDGENLLIQGKHYGNVFVGVQPGFGYEGDPMRLLFTKNAAAHHGFLAFYAYIKHVWKADAVLHFGTHGALEFMPGKQNGLSSECYPHELIGDLPNIYLYSVNNPSEAAIAKRRSYATTISYLTPTNARAGLYRTLEELQALIHDYHSSLATPARRQVVLEMIIEKAKECHFDIIDDVVESLQSQLDEIRSRLIPLGLRIAGEQPQAEELLDLLNEMSRFERPELGLPSLFDILGKNEEHLSLLLASLLNENIDTTLSVLRSLKFSRADRKSAESIIHFFRDLKDRIVASDEITPIISALEGKYTPPGPGGDLLRVPQALPVGRNITSLNPLAMPSAVAARIAKRTTGQLLERARKEKDGAYPECIGMVLWGLDNIKTGGEAIAQAFHLLGVEVIPDALGNMTRLRAIPLEELERPRIDCVFTVSGIFRDMFGHQMNMLDQAVRLVAKLDEPNDVNFIRKHTSELASRGISEEEALYRVFSNASGTYGTNVDYMVMSGNWEEQKDLADIFSKRKGFTFGAKRSEKRAPEVLRALAGYIDTTYQNLDSSEIGISDVDHYYEYLGGLTNLASVTSGKKPKAYVADTTTATGIVRTLEETVALEARTKVLNPKWYEAMLKHGYEGADEIKRRVDYTYGWSATADATPTWFYDEVHETYIRNEDVRERMREANPDSFNAMVERLYEAHSRGFWEANDKQLQELRDLQDGLLDEMEGMQEKK